ncbi:MAG: ComEC/Rec2 family competence protein [Thermaurantimonas sp.]
MGIILYSIEFQKIVKYRGDFSGLSVVKIERILKKKETDIHLKGLIVDSIGYPLFRAVLYLPKDSLTDGILPGDLLMCSGTFTPVRDVKIPYAFSPAKYFVSKGITHQSYIRTTSIIKHEKREHFNLFRIAWMINRTMVDVIQKWPGAPKDKEVLIALLTGTKDYLSESTRTVYSDTGIIHVLAVSGLHTGLIYLLVSYFLSFFFGSHYRIFQAIFVIGSLWFYALFTGLTPSVIRAATMFTFIQTGLALRRKTGIYHSLCLSALVILSCSPFMLYDIGFQLSYSAVFGIVTISRFINKLLDFSSQILLKKISELVSVSVAAQVFTMPFTIYYFSKFPTWFFLANIYAIPLVTLALFIGFPTAVLSIFLPQIHILGILPSLIIRLNNYLTECIQSAPLSTITDIYISDVQFLLCMAFTILCSIGWVYRKKIYLFTSLILVVLFLIHSVVHSFNLSKNVLRVELYSVHNAPVVLLYVGSGFGAIVYTKDQSYRDKISFSLSKYLKSKALDESQIEWIQNPHEIGIKFNGHRTLLVQFNPNYFGKKPKLGFYQADPTMEAKVCIVKQDGERIFLNRDGDRIFIPGVSVDNSHNVMHQSAVFDGSL